MKSVKAASFTTCHSFNTVCSSFVLLSSFVFHDMINSCFVRFDVYNMLAISLKLCPKVSYFGMLVLKS